MNMKSLSKFPFWGYYASLSFYFYYSWSTRTGLYPFIMQIDKDSIEITALVLIVVAIMLPAVVMKYVFGWDRPTTPLEEAPRLTAMVAVALFAFGVVSGWTGYQKSQEPFETVDLTAGQKPSTKQVIMTGIVQAQHTVRLQGDLQVYVPLTGSNWREGEPVLYFARTIDKTVDQGPSPYRMTPQHGVLIPNGVPEPILQAFRKKKIAIADQPILYRPFWGHPKREGVDDYYFGAGTCVIFGMVLVAFSAEGFRRRRGIPPLSPEQQSKVAHRMGYTEPVIVLVFGVPLLLLSVVMAFGQALGLFGQGLGSPITPMVFGLLLTGWGAFTFWQHSKEDPAAAVPAPATEARDDREARLMAMGAMYRELDQALDWIAARLDDRSTLAERKDLIVGAFANWDLETDQVPCPHCQQGLARDWNITDNASLVERLGWLLREGHQRRFERFVAALDASGGDKAAIRAQLGEAARIHDFDGTYAQVLYWRPRLTKSGILAWDLARAIQMMRNSYNAGFIDEDGCWAFLDKLEAPAAQIASWQEFAHSYLAGYEFWSGEVDMERREIVGRLLTHPCSPWVHFPWPQIPTR
jgi:uncharacterized protein DUF1266